MRIWPYPARPMPNPPPPPRVDASPAIEASEKMAKAHRDLCERLYHQSVELIRAENEIADTKLSELFAASNSEEILMVIAKHLIETRRSDMKSKHYFPKPEWLNEDPPGTIAAR